MLMFIGSFMFYIHYLKMITVLHFNLLCIFVKSKIYYTGLLRMIWNVYPLNMQILKLEVYVFRASQTEIIQFESAGVSIFFCFCIVSLNRKYYSSKYSHHRRSFYLR